MHKRPLSARLIQPVLQDIKITTIRDKPWPVGVPIMLYQWSALPYRSKHIDVAVIKVRGFWPIEIAHTADGEMRYAYGMENSKPLYQTEGFDSREELDDWFRRIVKPGTTTLKFLNLFHRLDSRP